MSRDAWPQVRGASSGAELRSLTLEVPPAPLGAFVSLPIDGPLVVWDATGAGEPFAFAARGVAACIDAQGESRARLVRRWSEDLLGGEEGTRAPSPNGAPPPRVFGAMTFAPDAPLDAPWQGFSDAHFVLPRIVYARGESRAFLRITLRRDPRDAAGDPSAELEAVRAALLAAAAPHAADLAPPGSLEEMPLEAWVTLVERALGAIDRGELQKVVLARRSHLRSARRIDVATVIERLAAGQPGGVRFAFEQGQGVFLGASPERLVTLRGKTAEMDALAGSVPRGRGSDEASAVGLLASSKDRDEHRHVVEGIRAALAPLGAVVTAPPEPLVRTLRTILHLWTPLRAELSAAAHVLDLVSALHPTPAVCGSPREAARSWIARNEPSARGVYAGPVGWLDGAGDGSFWVGLRSAVVRGNEAWLFAGAGLVAGSDARLEYEETRAKQQSVLSALRASP